MDQSTPNSNGSNGSNGATGSDGVSASQAASGAARERLMSELKTAIGGAESWLQDSAGQVEDAASDVRERFDDTLRTARSDLRKLEDSLLARSREAADAANIYVHDNPWKSVCLGAAAGLLIGTLLTRK